uniref:Uncharacterized protein n=1 Tax=Anguilla anguilla TaxID=7936 RepID=A0A0E9WYF8_ANGAN
MYSCVNEPLNCSLQWELDKAVKNHFMEVRGSSATWWSFEEALGLKGIGTPVVERYSIESGKRHNRTYLRFFSAQGPI